LRQVECDRIPPAGALEAFVVDETVYLFEDWRQAFREVELEIGLFLLGWTSKITENIAVASECQNSCRMSGRSVSPSADRIPVPQPRPSILSVDRLILLCFNKGKELSINR
jgi:hypothetical protein